MPRFIFDDLGGRWRCMLCTDAEEARGLAKIQAGHDARELVDSMRRTAAAVSRPVPKKSEYHSTAAAVSRSYDSRSRGLEDAGGYPVLVLVLVLSLLAATLRTLFR